MIPVLLESKHLELFLKCMYSKTLICWENIEWLSISVPSAPGYISLRYSEFLVHHNFLVYTWWVFFAFQLILSILLIIFLDQTFKYTLFCVLLRPISYFFMYVDISWDSGPSWGNVLQNKFLWLMVLRVHLVHWFISPIHWYVPWAPFFLTTLTWLVFFTLVGSVRY